MYVKNLSRSGGEMPFRDSYKTIKSVNESGVSVMSDDSNGKSYRKSLRKVGANRAAELLRYGKSKPGCLSLAQGEGSVPTPSFICDAVTKALAEGMTFYGPAVGTVALRQEIANYHARIYGHSIPINRITVTSSGTNAVHSALLSILEEDDEIVGVTPIWKNLIGITELAGGHIREVAMELTENGWHLDIEKLFAAVTPQTKAMMIVSPNNPTGWVMPSADIQTVLEFARAKGIWVIADEVYGRTLHDKEVAPSFLDYAEEDDRLYVVNSFSKTWAMTGWRLGWLIGPRDSEEKIRDVVLYETMGAPSFTQTAAIEALRHGEAFLKEQKSLWQANQDRVARAFSGVKKITMVPSSAAFYAFIRIEGETDSYDLAKRLIDEAGVSLAPGGSFGDGFHDYLRVCFGASPEILDEALNRIVTYFGKD